jgi:hypothetical protein
MISRRTSEHILSCASEEGHPVHCTGSTKRGLPVACLKARTRMVSAQARDGRHSVEAEIGRYMNASMAHPVAFDRSGERARHLRCPGQKSEQFA